MTGGTVPLSATLASKSVFEVFSGDSKVKSLHQFSGHVFHIYIYNDIFCIASALVSAEGTFTWAFIHSAFHRLFCCRQVHSMVQESSNK